MLALRVWLRKINPRVGRGPDPALDGAGGGISESPDLFWKSLKAHPIPALPKFPLGLLQTLPSQALHTARDGNSGAVLLLCEFLGGFGASGGIRARRSPVHPTGASLAAPAALGSGSGDTPGAVPSLGLQTEFPRALGSRPCAGSGAGRSQEILAGIRGTICSIIPSRGRC